MTPLDHSDHDERPLEPQRLERLEALLAQGLERRSAPPELSDRVRAVFSTTVLPNGESAEGERVRSILERLDHLSAPSELMARVDATLRADDAELERRAEGLESWLPPVAAPAELRERVRLELGTELPVADVVRGLERQRAPHVLERLVDEEIRDDKAATKRFVGSLPKPGAPRELDRVAHTSVDDVRRVTSEPGVLLTGPWRRALAAAALLLATGSIAWVVVDGRGEQNENNGERDLVERPTFRLQGRQVASLEELHPMARGLADGLGVLDVDELLNGGSATTDGGGR